MKKNILVVGCGFSGSVIARELANIGYQVTIIDKRDHIGGNCYDYVNEYGIRVHMYGPHLFHTRNKDVFDYLSKFTEWVEYKHKVKAILSNGQYVTLPVNQETSDIVGKDNVVDTFIRPYTKKMWGMDIEDIDPDILNRVPIRSDMNDLYFPDDEYQFMPKDGYTKLFENLLDHPNIIVKLNTPFDPEMECNYDYVFNSMPIDQYWCNAYGELPYRSIKFHTVSLPLPKLLPETTVNFTHSGKFTRMTEWKNIPNHGENDMFTTITYEEPCDYQDNSYERYYPVKDKNGANRERYKQYKSINSPNVKFIGRCGLYAYLNMDQAVSSALSIAKEFIQNDK